MDPLPPKYVIDSYALMAYFQAEEPAGSLVRNLLERATKKEIVLFMSLINLGEVYYLTSKELGNDIAHSLISDTYKLPININSVNDDHVWAAAELKSQYHISYADAFAASFAQMLHASIVTGDPEFKPIEDSKTLDVIWLS